MVSSFQFLFLPFFYVFIVNSTASRVIELSDRFLDIHKEGQWLVMMYAPWCAHCKRLDPVWSHVAQHLYATSIKVGRADCTRFTAIANNFKIRGYPTILFLNGEDKYEYHGDRTKDEIVDFALRLSGPPVKEITKTHSFHTIKKERDLYFLYVGEKLGPLWDIYHSTAYAFHPHAFFYQSHPAIVEKHAPVENTPVIFVYKENIHYNFSAHNASELDHINKTLHRWVNTERFSTFPKVTHGNIHQLYTTNKNLVLAVIEENAVSNIASDMVEFRDMVETVIRKNRDKYHEHFQFGWVGNADLANSIAMMHVPLPNLIVINTTTNHHHMPDDDPGRLTPLAIEVFLDSIHNDTATKYGGKSILVQIYRIWFETRSTLSSMWSGNPTLTIILFGLPLLFLSLICWGTFCPDIFDAGEEEEEEDTTNNHMKKD